MTLCFDLDRTLCKGYPYYNCKPFWYSKPLLSFLKARGHKIVIYTARGMGRHQNDAQKAHSEFYEVTKDQLDGWGFEYDMLLLGKPHYDVIIDDKAFGFRFISNILNIISPTV